MACDTCPLAGVLSKTGKNIPGGEEKTGIV